MQARLLVAALVVGLVMLGGGLALPTPWALAASFTVDTTADGIDADPSDGLCKTATNTCTLRAAIMQANALGGSSMVTLPAGTYTLTLAGMGEDAATLGDLDVAASITIQGAGAA